MNSSITWNLRIATQAKKELERIPAKHQTHILRALQATRDDPFSGDLVRLKNQPTAWRRRVGSYRIFFDVYPDLLLIEVLTIRRRTSTTY
jgi:mRNA-degrading endonuclease RelE of RelBE toxin-antitoxin system